MAMKIYKIGDLPKRRGALMLLYGEPGVGKSVTSLQTSEEPILYIMTEPKDVGNFLDAAGKGEGNDIEFAFYTNFDDLLELVNDHGFMEKYNTVIVDSISHLIQINLSDEILDESFEAMSGKGKKDVEKPLTMRVKMSQEGYGTLGGQMLRFTDALSRISQMGKTIVMLARVESSPKYNRGYAAAPSLKGQEYSKHFQGFLNFIGFVEQRIDHDGKVVYPPVVSFESDGSFMSRWEGKMPEGGVGNRILHVEKILNVSRGKMNGKGGTKGKEKKAAVKADEE